MHNDYAVTINVPSPAHKSVHWKLNQLLAIDIMHMLINTLL